MPGRNLQTTNKLHCVKPIIGALPIMRMRRTVVKLTLLRIGHTRYTHRHLLLGINSERTSSSESINTPSELSIFCDSELLKTADTARTSSI
ncbi:hypothetical protein TNCV_2290371 [Trichonephila clavipes]|uniref:Uncharacterized protein n=1 Tax=Trichonephila clavipes TaxID=2585209 RepID=A0A8X6V1W4_TRICX|nr:hypothetical protein TNCV_2290371 [Trichonephila clavipes]